MKKAIQNTYIKNLHTPINKAQGNFQGFGKKFNKLPPHLLELTAEYLATFEDFVVLRGATQLGKYAILRSASKLDKYQEKTGYKSHARFLEYIKPEIKKSIPTLPKKFYSLAARLDESLTQEQLHEQLTLLQFYDKALNPKEVVALQYIDWLNSVNETKLANSLFRIYFTSSFIPKIPKLAQNFSQLDNLEKYQVWKNLINLYDIKYIHSIVEQILYASHNTPTFYRDNQKSVTYPTNILQHLAENIIGSKSCYFTILHVEFSEPSKKGTKNPSHTAIEYYTFIYNLNEKIISVIKKVRPDFFNPKDSINIGNVLTKILPDTPYGLSKLSYEARQEILDRYDPVKYIKEMLAEKKIKYNFIQNLPDGKCSVVSPDIIPSFKTSLNYPTYNHEFNFLDHHDQRIYIINTFDKYDSTQINFSTHVPHDQNDNIFKSEFNIKRFLHCFFSADVHNDQDIEAEFGNFSIYDDYDINILHWLRTIQVSVDLSRIRKTLKTTKEQDQNIEKDFENLLFEKNPQKISFRKALEKKVKAVQNIKLNKNFDYKHSPHKKSIEKTLEFSDYEKELLEKILEFQKNQVSIQE